MNTHQAYVFTNDNPLNATDPKGDVMANFQGGAGSVKGAENSYVAIAKTQVTQLLKNGGTLLRDTGLTAQAAAKIIENDSNSNIVLSQNQADSIVPEVAESLGEWGAAASLYGYFMIGYSDLSHGDGVIYTAADLATTATFAVAFSAVCGGPEDILGVFCGAAGAWLGHTVFRSLGRK
jgi:hypothetical protein